MQKKNIYHHTFLSETGFERTSINWKIKLCILSFIQIINQSFSQIVTQSINVEKGGGPLQFYWMSQKHGNEVSDNFYYFYFKDTNSLLKFIVFVFQKEVCHFCSFKLTEISRNEDKIQILNNLNNKVRNKKLHPKLESW